VSSESSQRSEVVNLDHLSIKLPAKEDHKQENKEEKEEKEGEPVYNRKVLDALYYLVFLTSLFDNIDHGSLPAGTTEIREDLCMEND
jgi:MFS family permease